MSYWISWMECSWPLHDIKISTRLCFNGFGTPIARWTIWWLVRHALRWSVQKHWLPGLLLQLHLISTVGSWLASFMTAWWRKSALPIFWAMINTDIKILVDYVIALVDQAHGPPYTSRFKGSVWGGLKWFVDPFWSEFGPAFGMPFGVYFESNLLPIFFRKPANQALSIDKPLLCKRQEKVSIL